MLSSVFNPEQDDISPYHLVFNVCFRRPIFESRSFKKIKSPIIASWVPDIERILNTGEKYPVLYFFYSCIIEYIAANGFDRMCTKVYLYYNIAPRIWREKFYALILIKIHTHLYQIHLKTKHIWNFQKLSQSPKKK